MRAPSQRRVTWSEVAEWLPDGEAEVAFDRDVAPSGLDATLYLRACFDSGRLDDGLVLHYTEAYEIWAIDEEAPLTAHEHDVRAHGITFPVRDADPGSCRCRVWRGPERGWRRAGSQEKAQRAKRGLGLYMVDGGRATFIKRP